MYLGKKFFMNKDTLKRVCVFVIGVAITWICLVAGRAPMNNQNLNVGLSLEEWKYVLTIMSKEPMKDVSATYQKIELQLVRQLNDSTPAPAKPKK